MKTTITRDLYLISLGSLMGFVVSAADDHFIIVAIMVTFVLGMLTRD